MLSNICIYIYMPLIMDYIYVVCGADDMVVPTC